MKIIALDVGTKSLGLAISDEFEEFSFPLKTINFNNFLECFDELLSIIEEKKVQKIIIGLPKNMDSTSGFAAKRSMDFKEELLKRISLPVEFVDERLSSVEAEKYLINEDMSRKKRKKYIDSVAASIILDTYLRTKKDKRSNYE